MSARPGRRRLALWLLLAWAGLSACGYRAGLTLEGGRRSLAIEMFGNDGPLPGIERELHAEIVRSARNMLSVVILDPDQAEVIVRGRISAYSTRGGLRTKGNRLRSKRVSVSAEAELWSASGELLRGPVRASVSVGFLNGPQPEDEEARQRAFKNAADELLLKLLVPAPIREAPAV